MNSSSRVARPTSPAVTIVGDGDEPTIERALDNTDVLKHVFSGSGIHNVNLEYFLTPPPLPVETTSVSTSYPSILEKPAPHSTLSPSPLRHHNNHFSTPKNHSIQHVWKIRTPLPREPAAGYPGCWVSFEDSQLQCLRLLSTIVSNTDSPQ